MPESKWIFELQWGGLWFLWMFLFWLSAVVAFVVIWYEIKSRRG